MLQGSSWTERSGAVDSETTKLDFKRTLRLLVSEFVSVVSRATGDGLRVTNRGSGRTVLERRRRRRLRRWFTYMYFGARRLKPTDTAVGVQADQSATRFLDVCTRPRHPGPRTTTKSKMATVSDDNTVYILI